MVTKLIIVVFGLAILTPPIICYAIARIENRNAGRWFWYGLFFGIFAVIYLVFYAKEDAEDKIRPRIMALLGILMLLMIFALYQTILVYR
jgi:hypothetical protein